MFVGKLQNLVWGLGGVVLGVALSAATVGALRPSAATSAPPAKLQTEASVEGAESSSPLSQSIVLTVVKDNEIRVAIKDFPDGVQKKILLDVSSGKYRLLWLTVWDWDTAPDEAGNTISILTD